VTGGKRIERRGAAATMRIVMVTNNALEDKIGGQERYVRELASALSRRGAEVSIVAKRRNPGTPRRELCADGVTLERYPVPSKANPLYAPLYPLYTARGVRARTRRRARTVIHVHMGLPALPLALAREPYLLTFHAPVWRELLSERQGTYLLPPGTRTLATGSLRRVEGLVATRASATVVLSEFMRSELARLSPRTAEQATLLPGGIDTTRFTPAANGRSAGRDREPVLFTARRLTRRTGVDQLIRAMPTIARARPDVRLKIAGAGPMERELRDLARALGLGRSVEFMGRISDAELVAAYRRSTLVVLPTRELEGFGLTTAEALACGAAVIGTPAGATPELLEPVDPALVTAGAAAAEIADSITTLLLQPERLRGIRDRALARVVPAMSWDRVADRYLEIYERLQRC
jgi:glycosyltransferase involved in cell wall biosynthesis